MTPVSVAILAGGESRRLGADKALLRLRDGSAPLLGMVVDVVTRITDDVFIVGRRAGYEQFGVPVFEDLFGPIGPLGGIGSALHIATHERVLVVSCDMPFLSLPLLTWIASHTGDFDALVPRIDVRTGNVQVPVYQTLHALYLKSCLPSIKKCISEGDRTVYSFYTDIALEVIPEHAARGFDPELLTYFNVNTRSDLDFARSILARGESSS